jgi:hypothetical protein
MCFLHQDFQTFCSPKDRIDPRHSVVATIEVYAMGSMVAWRLGSFTTIEETLGLWSRLATQNSPQARHDTEEWHSH